MTQRSGDRRRGEQDVDEQIAEVGQEPEERTSTRRLRQPIGPVNLQATRYLIAVQTIGRRLNGRQRVGGGERVKGLLQVFRDDREPRF